MVKENMLKETAQNMGTNSLTMCSQFACAHAAGRIM